jgi:hypothetical protein
MSGMITKEEALLGRTESILLPLKHFVNQKTLAQPYPENMQQAMFGLGCFWGAERIFWEIEGVYITLVGYSAGYTENPSYQEVCSGMTGHNEVVLVVYDPAKVSYEELLKLFWQSHNQPVQVITDVDLTGQPGVGAACGVDVEHGLLELAGLANRLLPGIINKHVAGTAGTGAAAVGVNTGYQIIDGGLHHRVAIGSVDNMFCAVVFDIGNSGHDRSGSQLGC